MNEINKEWTILELKNSIQNDQTMIDCCKGKDGLKPPSDIRIKRFEFAISQIEKLAEYENTELSPAKITKMREEVERLEKESADKERAYLEEFNLCKETIRELNFYKFYNTCSPSDCPCKYQEQCDRFIKPRVDLVDKLCTENKRLEKALENAESLMLYQMGAPIEFFKQENDNTFGVHIELQKDINDCFRNNFTWKQYLLHKAAAEADKKGE